MKIVFCHNVYNRFNTLLENIMVEKTLYPNSHSVIGFNVNSPHKKFMNFKNIDFLKFPGITHKIGCANGCIATIKHALTHEPDVIVFSHDDVMLNPDYQSIFEENIKLISDGSYDVICRKPANSIYGDNYYLMEVFFMSKSAAEKIFKNMPLFRNESEIHRDVRGSLSPEVFLHTALNSVPLKVKELTYHHTLTNYNDTLSKLTGYIHKNAGDRGWTD